MVPAIVIMVATAPPRAVADHLRGVERVPVVDLGGVVGGVEPVNGDVDDPSAVEVDQPMSKCPFLVVCLEKRPTPLNPMKLHEPLGWGVVYKAGLLGNRISDRLARSWRRTCVAINTIRAMPSGYQNN